MEKLKSLNIDGVEYFQLYISCPVCLAQGLPTTPSYWYHAVDGGEVYIGDNGCYYCKDCGYKDLIVNWAYNCPTHQGTGLGEYVKVDNLKHIAEAISIIGQVTKNPLGTLKWMRRVLAQLEEQAES